MSGPLDRQYIEQLYSGVTELAAELRNQNTNKYMSRERLQERAELLAWRIKSLDDEIKRVKILPEMWT